MSRSKQLHDSLLIYTWQGLVKTSHGVQTKSADYSCSHLINRQRHSNQNTRSFNDRTRLWWLFSTMVHVAFSWQNAGGDTQKTDLNGMKYISHFGSLDLQKTSIDVVFSFSLKQYTMTLWKKALHPHNVRHRPRMTRKTTAFTPPQTRLSHPHKSHAHSTYTPKTEP